MAGCTTALPQAGAALALPLRHYVRRLRRMAAMAGLLQPLRQKTTARVAVAEGQSMAMVVMAAVTLLMTKIS